MQEQPGLEKGKLYIVATPIGNLDDITLRALNILSSADWVAAEDTRHTGKLLSHHKISASLVSCHEHNEQERIPGLIRKLDAGASGALVSDAGTPSVSDPGYRLVKAAIERGITVIPIPGVSAAITALSVSGLPTDHFLFIGFPPKKQGKRLAQLKRLANETATLVFYESPKRILSFMEEIRSVMGDRHGVLSREMTKHYEEFLRGPLSQIFETLRDRPSVKGELTLLIQGFEKNGDVPMEAVAQDIREKLASGNFRLSDLSKQIAKKYGIPRKKVYEEALRIQKEQAGDSCFANDSSADMENVNA